MNAPTKEELCDELMKSDLNGLLYFYAQGTGGCDGPPNISVRVKKEELSGVPDGDTIHLGAPAKKFDEFYSTIDYFYIEKNGLRRPRVYTENTGARFDHFRYKDYNTLQDLASAVVSSIMKNHKIKSNMIDRLYHVCYNEIDINKKVHEKRDLFGNETEAKEYVKYLHKHDYIIDHIILRQKNGDFTEKITIFAKKQIENIKLNFTI